MGKLAWIIEGVGSCLEWEPLAFKSAKERHGWRRPDGDVLWVRNGTRFGCLVPGGPGTRPSAGLVSRVPRSPSQADDPRARHQILGFTFIARPTKRQKRIPLGPASLSRRLVLPLSFSLSPSFPATACTLETLHLRPPLMFPFHRLAPDVFDTIAHYVGTADPLGPPASLASFLRTDRFIYSHLNPRQNPHLWANLFRHSFDMAALRRRFPSDWLTSSCLANEFERRWKSLARIRKTARTNNWTKKVYRESHIAEDMLTVFLMLTESDGKNAIQLIQWANVDDWISSYTYKFFVEALTRNPRMPPEKPIWSLALWITWMLTDYGESGV